MEERLHVTIPPWMYGVRVHFRLDIGAPSSETRPTPSVDELRRPHLATLPADAVWVWSDGSAEGGVSAGRSSALTVLPTASNRSSVPQRVVC